MDDRELKSTIEAILFASGEPMPTERIALVLGLDQEEIIKAAKALSDEYSFQQRGIRLVRMDNVLQLCSAPEYAQSIAFALERRKPPKLSQPALEVLAICAYFQPVTRAYVDQVRGVDSSYTMGILLDRGLIEACGKLDVAGRPSIYKTSELFLRTMGITNLAELPKLPDMSSDDGIAKLSQVIDSLKSGDNKQLEIEN
ncbi:MAG: SMC-Scp complex subunit ScpB [Oscillospiraceae bacterium]|nr:SMC-Scp complex subunit ScpB [Oscillospiraceae bacterium]